MYEPRSASTATTSFPPAVQSDSTSRSVRQLHENAPLMRKYAAACITQEGREEWVDRIAPATPDFEHAFSAVSHSAQIYSPNGPIQASDIIPGDRVTCASGKTRRVVWVGSMIGVPTMESPHLPDFRLIRISSEAFGLDRPMGDLTLAPHAALSLGREIISAGDRVDGDAVCEIMPQSSVRMFNIMLDEPDNLLANGIPIVSYRPSLMQLERMGPNRKALFTSFFPHMQFEQPAL